jgi:hypothetical protein
MVAIAADWGSDGHVAGVDGLRASCAKLKEKPAPYWHGGIATEMPPPPPPCMHSSSCPLHCAADACTAEAIARRSLLLSASL